MNAAPIAASVVQTVARALSYKPLQTNGPLTTSEVNPRQEQCYKMQNLKGYTLLGPMLNGMMRSGTCQHQAYL